MANPFDAFDQAPQGNPFDAFDSSGPSVAVTPEPPNSEPPADVPDRLRPSDFPPLSPAERSRTGELYDVPAWMRQESRGTEPDPINTQPLIPSKYVDPALRAAMAVPTGGMSELARHLPVVGPAVQGVQDSAANAVSGFTSPANLAMLAAFPEGKIPATIIGSYFEAEAIRNTPQLWAQYQAATDPKEKVKLLSDMAIGLGLPLATLFHTAGRPEKEVSSPIVEAPSDTNLRTSEVSAGLASGDSLTSTEAQGIQSRTLPTEPALQGQQSAQPDLTTAPLKGEEQILPNGQPKGIAQGLHSLGENQRKAGLDISAEAIDSGDTKRLTFQKPATIEMLSQSPDHNVVINPDGSATVVGVRDSEGNWHGEPKSNELAAIEAPSVNTEVGASAQGGPRTTGIAQRVNEARTEQGKIGEILPGEGVSAEEMVNRGRDLISQGTKPEDVLSRFQDSGRISGDDLSVLRARLERYSKETNAAEEAMSANPRDPSAVAAYDQAWNRETDWARAIKPAATEWHKIGQAMQGETDLFDGSFTGMRRMIREEQNRDVEPAEVPKLRQTAEKVQRASRAEAAARQRFQEKAGEITKNAKRMTPDELKAHFAERMKKLLPC